MTGGGVVGAGVGDAVFVGTTLGGRVTDATAVGLGVTTTCPLVLVGDGDAEGNKPAARAARSALICRRISWERAKIRAGRVPPKTCLTPCRFFMPPQAVPTTWVVLPTQTMSS